MRIHLLMQREVELCDRGFIRTGGLKQADRWLRYREKVAQREQIRKGQVKDRNKITSQKLFEKRKISE